MTSVSIWALSAVLAFAAYTFFGYPAILLLLAAFRRQRPMANQLVSWPTVTIVLPVYNEEAVIRRTLENLLQLDYPADRLDIVVVSDASTDRTDAIVKEFASRGVQLTRMPRRGGKTAAENAVRHVLRGEIIVHTDASVHVARNALKPLIASFADPAVGVASSHNVSVARIEQHANYAESWYVGYDMWVRDLETRLAGIVGAAGCFYAARASVQTVAVPDDLSPDFAASLLAQERGFRSVSVRNALCFVPRIPSLRREYRRKVRTITRGWQTLWFKRALLNPVRSGAFAWILASHKICRWLIPHVGVVGLVLLAYLSPLAPWARWVLALAAFAGLCAVLGWWWPESRRLPKILALPAYVVIGNLAALHAFIGAVRGARAPTWEPTRREAVQPAEVG